MRCQFPSLPTDKRYENALQSKTKKHVHVLKRITISQYTVLPIGPYDEHLAASALYTLMYTLVHLILISN